MKVITNIGGPGFQPGDVIDIPDNEAPGLIRQGYARPVPSKGDGEAKASKESKATKKNDIRDSQER